MDKIPMEVMVKMIMLRFNDRGGDNDSNMEHGASCVVHLLSYPPPSFYGFSDEDIPISLFLGLVVFVSVVVFDDQTVVLFLDQTVVLFLVEKLLQRCEFSRLCTFIKSFT